MMLVLNDDIRELARAFLENYDQSLLPILADALEEQGFTRSRLLLVYLRRQPSRPDKLYQYETCSRPIAKRLAEVIATEDRVLLND